MNFRRVIFAICFLAFFLPFAVTSRAQEEPQTQEPQPQQPQPQQPEQPAPDTPPGNPIYGPPKPAGYSFPGIYGVGEGELQPDFSPLTGFQNSTLGFPEVRHSYWVPGFQFSSNVLSNPANQAGVPSWYADNYFIGDVSLLEAWSRATLAINYSAGGFVSTESSLGNGYYQQLALAQNFITQRWLIQIVDRLAQSPQSEFGFGGGTGLGVPGVGGSLGTTIPGLGGNYVPNQSVYGVGPYISNTAALQATYALSHRGSITVAGSYGIMSFSHPGNIDTNNTVASIGYNYVLTPKDTVGLVYRFSSYQYPGSPQAYGDNVISLAYGRKVTGHIALRLFVGPDVANYRIPVGNSSRTVGFTTSVNMTYAFQSGAFSVGYSHGLSGGSGVLVGSVLDQANASVSRKLTRVWNASVNFGYAQNSPVGGTALSGYPSYNDWFMGGNISRPFGRNLNFALAYTATIGNYGGYGCTGAGCTTTNTYNTVTVNLQWHPRPFILP
jgi:hypothetical protein